MSRLTPFALIGLLPTACITAPLNEAPPGGAPAQPVSISGYAPSASSTVQIQASPSGTGDWVLVGTTQTSASATTFWDGTKQYAFSTQVVIPAHRWSKANCTESQTFLRMRSGAISLPTFDHESVSGESALDCMTAEQQAGTSFYSAVLACQSPQSPVSRVRAQADHSQPAHVGDLVIDDPADVEAHACVQGVQGNLTIAGPWTLPVAMPWLTEVTGSLNVDYPRQPNETFPEVRAPELPALTTIGDHLNLTSSHPGGGSQIISVPFGMNALTTVGGDIDIDIETFNTSASGFGSLTQHAGDLSVVTGTGDTSGFLNHLVSVGGDVHLDLGHTLNGILTSLQTVGGDLALVDGNPTPNVLEDLVSVGGDFTLGAIEVNGPGGTIFFPALGDVAGRITLAGTQLDDLHLGAQPLQAGALTIDGNATLSALTPADIQVVGPGSIEVTDNPALCSSLVTSFLSGQLGWTGSSVVAGNDDGC